jgi:hypothetical protein
MPKRKVRRSLKKAKRAPKRKVVRRNAGAPPPRLNENKVLFRRYIDPLLAYPGKNPKALDDLLAPSFVAHDLPPGVDLRSVEQAGSTPKVARADSGGSNASSGGIHPARISSDDTGTRTATVVLPLGFIQQLN